MHLHTFPAFSFVELKLKQSESILISNLSNAVKVVQVTKVLHNFVLFIPI